MNYQITKFSYSLPTECSRCKVGATAERVFPPCWVGYATGGRGSGRECDSNCMDRLEPQLLPVSLVSPVCMTLYCKNNWSQLPFLQYKSQQKKATQRGKVEIAARVTWNSIYSGQFWCSGGPREVLNLEMTAQFFYVAASPPSQAAWRNQFRTGPNNVSG